MVIWRCAWHRQYFGYRLLNGVASWRGLTVGFTDGICRRCLERFRADHEQRLVRRRQERADRSRGAA
jgi:hypothetical protein